MSLFKFLKPKPTISDQEVTAGLRWLKWEGVATMGLYNVVSSGILVAFALMLGANNFQIGILAAIPFIMQILQIPSIWLVEKFRQRKAIVFISWLPAQLLWFPIALIPFFMPVPSTSAISLLLILIAIRGLLIAVRLSALNGWMRDLVPQSMLGRFFSTRLSWATIAGVIFSFAAAFFVDYWHGQVPGEDAVFGYTYVLFFSALFLGLASPVFISLMPEPLMQPVIGPQPSMIQMLSAPFRNVNFRRLIQFLFFWSFASNLAIPFFAIFMLQGLGLSISWVISLTILSQLFNILFLRVWGPLVDRFGSKGILSLCASLLLLVILGWTFATMPGKHFLTMPLLVILHIFAGIANAGITLTVGTIGLKLAPQGESTSYLAGASLATNLGAGIGPLFGGLLADFFHARQLNLVFTWLDPVSTIQLPALSFIGHDFLFVIAFIVGLITLGVLVRIREEGEVDREEILQKIMMPMREFPQSTSSVPEFTSLINFPFRFLKKVPLPGLDVAIGVTAYQINKMAKVATSAAIHGRRVTKKLSKTLERSLAKIWKNKKKLKEYGVEITRQVARGAMHVAHEKPLSVEQLVGPVVAEVIKTSNKAGVDLLDGISGTSQGIIQGAAETGIDLSETTLQVIKTVKKIAAQTGLSEELAIDKAIEGVLQATKTIGPEAAAEVAESLPEKTLSSNIKENKTTC